MSKNGFTLIELMISITIMGIMAIVTSSVWLNTASMRTLFDKHQKHNELIAIKQTLLDFASKDNKGKLPDPFSLAGYNSSCLDVTSPVYKSYLSRYSSTPLTSINNDGSVAKMVRVCQREEAVAYTQNVAGFGGETVDILFDAGVVYQTACPFDTGCNTGVPGTSAIYTATGWLVAGTDTDPVEYSTLTIEQSYWNSTYERLLSLRDAMINYRIDLVRTNAADDVTNWNIAPNLVASPDMSGATAATNQGCYDGWYDLSDEDNNVLPLYGLNQSLYGLTVKGSAIEYCRDYDPADKGADTPPHLVALRINRNVSIVTTPDNGDVANNFIISF